MLARFLLLWTGAIISFWLTILSHKKKVPALTWIPAVFNVGCSSSCKNIEAHSSSLAAAASATYSASMELLATVSWSQEDQLHTSPLIVKMYPDVDLLQSHEPAQPLSAHPMSIVRGLAPETQVGLSRYLVTIKLCNSYCLSIGLDELVAQQLSSCAMTAGGIHCIYCWVAWHNQYHCVGYDDTKVWCWFDDNEVDGVGDKVGGVNTSVQLQWTTAYSSIYIQTADLLWVTFRHQVVVIQHTHYDEEQP
ncbi:uncharacterized protein UHOR_14188 [Ustilago hordei]|uniref:Uncharacterized protein n=1 Tax=Ustilago hordei TaxID=120017 RepID=I2FSZ7_USTHO|nr:uncharacterized protein UHOR_14188 [Ustilago hordei]